MRWGNCEVIKFYLKEFCFCSYQKLGDLGLLTLWPSDPASPDYVWQMTLLALGVATLDDYCGFRQKMR